MFIPTWYYVVTKLSEVGPYILHHTLYLGRAKWWSYLQNSSFTLDWHVAIYDHAICLLQCACATQTVLPGLPVHLTVLYLAGDSEWWDAWLLKMNIYASFYILPEEDQSIWSKDWQGFKPCWIKLVFGELTNFTCLRQLRSPHLTCIWHLLWCSSSRSTTVKWCFSNWTEEEPM